MDVFYCLILAALAAVVWRESLRELGWGQPAPKVGPDHAWRIVVEFVGAPLWALMAFAGDALTREIERREKYGK